MLAAFIFGNLFHQENTETGKLIQMTLVSTTVGKNPFDEVE